MSKNLIGPESQVSCPVSDENQVKKKKKIIELLNTWEMIYSSMFIFPIRIL